jgi:hypothetical protein
LTLSVLPTPKEVEEEQKQEVLVSAIHDKSKKAGRRRMKMV